MSPNREERVLLLVQSGELEIDSQGRIWRLMRRFANGARLCPRHRAERGNPNYLQVSTMIDGVVINAYAHRLVWVSIHGPIPAGLTINHRNGIKSDNRPENLELATASEQMRHRLDVLKTHRGGCPPGSRHWKTKLTEEDVRRIRQLRKDGTRPTDLALEFDLSVASIINICARRIWKHV